MGTLLEKLLGIQGAEIPPGSEWGIAWRNLPDLWLIVLVLIPTVLLVTTWVYRHESRSAGRGPKLLLGALRALVLLLVLLVLFEPVLSIETSTTKETTVVFLIDESASMSIKDRLTGAEERLKAARATGIVPMSSGSLAAADESALDALTRIDLVNRTLANTNLGVIETIRKRHKVQVFSFSGALVRDPEVGTLEATGNESGIGEAIVNALKEMQSQIVVAMVLISDGRNTKGVNPIDVAGTTLQRDYAVPVYTIGVGNPREPRDIELKQMEGPDVALAKDIVLFTFRVRSPGFAGQEVEVTLQQGDGTDADPVVERKTITLEGGENDQEVQISYKPEEKGQFVCSIAIPAQPDELIVENNVIRREIQVVDHKIKVLYVDGYPRWEYRYLKNALVRDESVEVWVLLQSADPGFPQEGSRNVKPISEFPPDLKDLLQYDVIIFGDVDPNGAYLPILQPEKTLENIAEFVENFGGGFAMIAGSQDCPRSYRGTAVAKVLPIIPNEDFDGLDSSPRSERVPLKLTLSGREHPITQLELEPDKNVELWEDRDGQNDGLPGIFWYYPVKRVKSGASVLVARNSPTDANLDPIVAVQQVGRGRTMFVATDETWRWRFVRGDKYFYAFWRESLSWLRGGRLLGSKRFSLEVSPETCGPNDTVKIFARVYDAEYRPVDDATYPCTVELPGVETQEIELRATGKQPGRYAGEYKPRDLGTYSLAIGPQGLGVEKDRATAQFKVVFPNREFEQPSLDRDTLETVAERSGGVFLPIFDIDKLPEQVQRRGEATSTMITREYDLWDSPLLYLLFTALITLEWVIRKRFRLL